MTAVDEFSTLRLADGTPGSAADQRDLVSVQEFQQGEAGSVTIIDRNAGEFFTVATRPGAILGFNLFWPYLSGNRQYEQRTVSYELDRWNPEQGQWTPVLDSSVTRIPSQPVTRPDKSVWQAARVAWAANIAGNYRFRIQGTASDARLAGQTFDVAAAKYAGVQPLTFSTAKTPSYDPSGKYWFYIPRGTKSLDLELADPHGKILRLYSGADAQKLTASRQLQLSGQGTRRIPLQGGEDGSLASFERDPAAPGAAAYRVPYFYSIPMLWSRSPAELLVPRAVATADGLTVVK